MHTLVETRTRATDGCKQEREGKEARGRVHARMPTYIENTRMPAYIDNTRMPTYAETDANGKTQRRLCDSKEATHARACMCAHTPAHDLESTRTHDLGFRATYTRTRARTHTHTHKFAIKSAYTAIRHGQVLDQKHPTLQRLLGLRFWPWDPGFTGTGDPPCRGMEARTRRVRPRTGLCLACIHSSGVPVLQRVCVRACVQVCLCVRVRNQVQGSGFRVSGFGLNLKVR